MHESWNLLKLKVVLSAVTDWTSRLGILVKFLDLDLPGSSLGLGITYPEHSDFLYALPASTKICSWI